MSSLCVSRLLRPLPLAFAAHVAVTLAMLPDERRLRSAGYGIVDFELAGDPVRADEIMESWGEQGRAAARRSLAWDHAYMASYAVLGVLLVRRANGVIGARGPMQQAAEALPLLAMAADFVEGRKLSAVLDGDLPASYAARRAALTKFVALGLAAGHAVCAPAAYRLTHRG